MGVEGREGGPRCDKHGLCPGNREGTFMGGPPGDKSTKIVKTACEDEEFDLVPEAPGSHKAVEQGRSTVSLWPYGKNRLWRVSGKARKPEGRVAPRTVLEKDGKA